MAISPIPFPDFDRPPVIEVVLSVQFEPLPGFKSLHSSLLWQKYRKRFPNVEEHPPIEPQFETLTKPRAVTSGPRIELLDRPPALRLWFLNKRGDQLLQIQRDRFIHNWRKLETRQGYPRYVKIKSTFFKELELFNTFLKDEKLGSIAPNQCEVTYINHIYPCNVWQTHADADRVFATWARQSGAAFLEAPENCRFEIRYPLRSSTNKFAGRLHVRMQPGFKIDADTPIFVLDITARGEPIESSISGVMEFLDLGHENVVRSFVDLTTPEMHQVWEKRDVV